MEEENFRLAVGFALDVALSVVMSNHFHVVLYINSDKAVRWCNEEVLERNGRVEGVIAKQLKQLKRFVGNAPAI